MEFNAQQYQPVQGGFDKHPPGIWDFTISATKVQPTASNDGGMFVVEFTSAVGKIQNRYNLWNKSTQAVEIANKELSCLCHATATFQLSFPEIPNSGGMPDVNQPQGSQLIGKRGKMEVMPQKDKDGKENGYMEVKRVFDMNGNDPSKPGTPPVQSTQQGGQQPQGWGNPSGGGGQQPQPQGNQQAPMTQQPNGSWGNAQPQGQQQPQQNQQPQGWQQPNQNPGQQGNAGGGQPQTPPWGGRS